MSRITLILLALALIAMSTTTAPARAHSAAWAFPAGLFPPGFDRQEYRFHTSVPTGGWRASINAGAAEWNRHNRRFHFVAPGSGTPSVTGPATIGCPRDVNAPRPSIVYRADNGPGHASASPCFDRQHDHPTFFRVWIDPRANHWWTRSSRKIPHDRFDLQSTATHEFGHGLGFLPHYDDDDGDADEIREYRDYCRLARRQSAPSTGEGAPYLTPRNQDDINTGQQTMCAVIPPGSTHRRGLGQHDRGTFRNAYGPR